MELHRRHIIFGAALVLGLVAVLFLTLGRNGPQSAQAAGATMTLSVSGGGSTCAGSSPDVKCSVDPDVPFTVTITGDATGTDIGGFQTEFFFTGLTYTARATCADEVNLLPISLCLPSQWPPAEEAGGQIIHGGLTSGFGADPATKGATGETLVELDLTCETEGAYKIALTAGGQASSTPLASQFNDTFGGVEVYPKSVGTQLLDYDGEGGGVVPVADTLAINCGEVAGPTETPTATATTEGPTATPTATTEGPTATPTATATEGGPTATPTNTVPATATSTSVPPTETPTPTDVIQGDADGNGIIDARDALWILWVEAGLADALPEPEAGDADKNGVINSIDALFVLWLELGAI